MYKLTKIYKQNYIQLKYSLILILFWISINTGSKYVTLEYFKSEFNDNFLNFFRAYIPYLIFFYFIFNFRLIKKRNYDFGNLFLLFFFYGLFQLSGLLYNPTNIYEHYWIVCLFSLLLFFNSVQKEKQNIENLIFQNNIMFMFVIFVVFVFITFRENIFSNNLLYQSSAFNILYNNEQIPRSSGLSRMGLLIFIFLNSLYFSKGVNFNKLGIIFINIILISIILLLQSRGTILCFVIIFVLINIFYKFDNLLHRAKYFSLIIIIPLIFFTSYSNGKIFLINAFGEKDEISQPKKKLKLKNIEINLREDFVTNQKDESLKNKIYAFSNNRMNAWDFLLQVFIKNEINEEMNRKLIHQGYKIHTFQKKNKINFLTGYGPQADRFFLQNESKENASKNVIGPFGAHASNGYIYSLICSGIFGLIIFLAINFIVFFKILRLIIHNNFNFIFLNPYLTSSVFTLIFLQLRFFFENSFTIYGVDLIIFLSSYLILEKYYKRIKF
ncbi:hypothetical protein [Candidatus Pelagibacter sp.]|uniref:hypothetical protein n=1 Tax=Candidatus Pelagibacter sp. TaxID=2024849 RepID=UPI003F84F24F